MEDIKKMINRLKYAMKDPNGKFPLRLESPKKGKKKGEKKGKKRKNKIDSPDTLNLDLITPVPISHTNTTVAPYPPFPHIYR